MIDKTKQNILLRYSSVGMEFILTVGLLLAGGVWLDRRLGSMPAFTLVGVILGFAVALTRLVREGRKLQREEEEKNDHTSDD
jgi:F0F1-type ATP synthase assembly protein I